MPLNENGKNTDGETYLFRYAEENDAPIVTNIEREDEYMAAAEAFHDFIANLKSEAELEEEGEKLISENTFLHHDIRVVKVFFMTS